MSDIVVELAKRGVITQTGLVTTGPDGQPCANQNAGFIKDIVDSGVPISGGGAPEGALVLEQATEEDYPMDFELTLDGNTGLDGIAETSKYPNPVYIEELEDQSWPYIWLQTNDDSDYVWYWQRENIALGNNPDDPDAGFQWFISIDGADIFRQYPEGSGSVDGINPPSITINPKDKMIWCNMTFTSNGKYKSNDVKFIKIVLDKDLPEHIWG